MTAPTSERVLAAAYALADRQFGVASRAQLGRLGLSPGAISHRVRTGEWAVLHPSVYDLHAILREGPPHGPPLLKSVQLAHPGRAPAVLTTAGRLWDLPYCAEEPTHVRTPPGLEQLQRPGIRFHTWAVEPADITTRGGFLVTTPRRTVADLLLHSGRIAAVSILDSAMHQGYLRDEHDLTVIAAILGGRRGCRRARTYLPQAARGAQSPLETRIRLIATGAGLPPDRLQVPVHDEHGVLLGYGDIGWRTSTGWLIAECDGVSVHSLPEALVHDRRRQNELLRRPGIRLIRFSWADADRPEYVISTIRRALAPSSVELRRDTPKASA